MGKLLSGAVSLIIVMLGMSHRCSSALVLSVSVTVSALSPAFNQRHLEPVYLRCIVTECDSECDSPSELTIERRSLPDCVPL